MGVIRQLDAATVAKIAAGEVIERPASVVKELVENSIDAGARRIVVTCRRGGFDLVQVADDGCGLAPEDAPAAFARHSTSKLARPEDLLRVTTLGFRGEALASMAAVARVEMVTCPRGAASGTRVAVEVGHVVAVEEAAARPGTRVTVREVLAGLPARRKFLSDPYREGLRCVEAVIRLAAGYPHIAFRMEVDDRVVLSTPGDGDLLGTLAALHGPDLARSLVPLAPPPDGLPPPVLGVTGYLGGPSTFRSRRWSQTVYVNGRPVRAPGLLGVVEAAYGPLLPPGRHPFVILLLSVDPARVDVNIHPAKVEVRLQGEEGVRSVLRAMTARTLAASDLAASLLSAHASAAATGFDAGVARPGMRAGTEGLDGGAAGAGTLIGPTDPWPARAPGEDGRWEGSPAASVGERGPAWEFSFCGLRVIGQALGTYLLAEGAEGLYVVDQHAAHERVFYETMTFPQRSQLLLIPLVAAMGTRDREILNTFREEVDRAGFTVDFWEGDTVALRAVPAWAAGREESVLRELLDRLGEPAGDDREECVRRAAAACRAAVKAAQPLDTVEAQALMDQLARCRNPWVCPHGRPTVLKVTRAELERHFGRT